MSKNLLSNLLLFMMISLVITTSILLNSCSPFGTTPKSSETSLIYYVEQYREMSREMSRKYVEGDYLAVENLIKQSSSIPALLDKVDVPSAYERPKQYAINWMMNDLYWFTLAIYGGSRSEMNIIFDNAMEYLFLYRIEMEQLGHEMK